MAKVVNKVIVNGATKMDLTGDTATAGDVAQGKTFHLANGTQATGTATLGGSFRGAFATKAALDAYTGDKETGDTAVVLTDETTLSHTCRYKYNGTSWDLEEDTTKTQFLASCPIGRCVIFFDSAGSPSDRGLGGGWTQIATAVLRAATNNNTGGEDSWTMTQAQMVEHEHDVLAADGSGKSFMFNAWVQEVMSGVTGGSWLDYVKHGGGFLYAAPTGSTSSISNLPVYQNVYVYRRLS